MTDVEAGSDKKSSDIERNVHGPNKEVASDLSILTFVGSLAGMNGEDFKKMLSEISAMYKENPKALFIRLEDPFFVRFEDPERKYASRGKERRFCILLRQPHFV